MKKIQIEVTAPKASETWKLNVFAEIPDTIKEWTNHVGETALLTAIERFHVIRAQDLGRRMKVGGKTHAPSSDAEIIQAVQGFKFGVRTVVQVRVTPEAAIAALSGLGAADLKAAIELLMAKASELEVNAQGAKQD